MANGYRFAFDLGARSIGWCVLELDGNGDPCAIADIGARLFPDGRDPQKGASLAVDRRVARGMRRRRDRYLLRRDDLIKALVGHGLMPEDAGARKQLERLDPYELRARGLDEALTPFEFGRALFHLSQRRGFRSNRKSDRGADKETGKIKTAIGRLAADMESAGARTVGEYLHRRREEGGSVRARLHGTGASAEYDLYLQRAMLEAEYDALWTAQRSRDPGLSGAAETEIREILFRQRPLRPVDPGKCTLDPTDSRAPRALPLFQNFRMLQELANLTVRIPGHPARPLTIAERDALFDDLKRYPKRSFEQMRKRLGLPGDAVFNLHSEKRDGLKGDETAAVLAHKDRFGKDWRGLDFADQSAIVERLLEEDDEDALVAWLESEWKLPPDAARAICNGPLPEGYGRLGRGALGRIVPLLLSETVEATDPESGEVLSVPITYDHAALKAGYHHSDLRPEERLARLPYYGRALERHTSGGTGDPADPEEVRYGRIANPTVHIGLNQFRRVMNGLIEAHGNPDQVAIELTRELKLGRERVAEIERDQAARTKENERIDAEIAKLGESPGGENRRRFRLWEELDVVGRRCVYTGDPISARMALSGDTEIDHILPFSRSLDDGIANQILCLARANRDKTGMTPHEAFGHDPGGYDYADILARATELPAGKRWRFDPDAAERMERDGGFLARHLNDTAYLARMAKFYAGHVCYPDSVWVTPGRLTAMLRGRWGLNSLLPDANFAQVAQEKNRMDHRHHAIDAFVTGVTDRSLLQRMATAAGRSETERQQRILAGLDGPWDGFRDQLRDRLAAIVVSHKPDHGVTGKLHEETAYGLIADPAAWGGHNLVYRKAFADLNENEIARVRDPDLRREVQSHVANAKRANGGKPLPAADMKRTLAAFAEKEGPFHNTRRVRLMKKEAEVIPIRDGDGRAYKAYSPGDNHHIDIYELPDGSWQGQAVTVFDANRKDYRPDWRRDHPGARLALRVHKGDLIRVEPDGAPEYMRVVRLNAKAGRLYLAGHTEAGDLQKRHDDPDDPFRWLFASYGRLREMKARRVNLGMLGRPRE